MPRTWFYFIALLLPLVAAVLVFDTRIFLEWLWYHGYEDYFNTLNELSVQPELVDIFGGWPFPIFIGTVFCYWVKEFHEPDAITLQFLLLPVAFVPFLIIGHALTVWHFDSSTLYSYPLVVIPMGYLYVLPWAVVVWALSKLGLVV